MPAAPYRPELPTSGPSRFGVFRFRHPRQPPVRPCGFQRLASPVSALVQVKTPPAQVIHDCLSFSHVPDPDRAIIAAWPGLLLPATLMGFLPFAALLRFAGDSASRRLAPTCRFALRPPRVSSSRGPPIRADQGAFGRGFWGLAPRTSRTVQSVGPAIAFAHRAEQIHLPLLPWACSLSQVFTIRRRSPFLETFPPGLVTGAIDVSAATRTRQFTRHAPAF